MEKKNRPFSIREWRLSHGGGGGPPFPPPPGSQGLVLYLLPRLAQVTQQLVLFCRPLLQHSSNLLTPQVSAPRPGTGQERNAILRLVISQAEGEGVEWTRSLGLVDAKYCHLEWISNATLMYIAQGTISNHW